MRIRNFELERYFAKYEFKTPYLLCSSDCEPIRLNELLLMADIESLKLWENLSLAYTESQGNPVLRDEISLLYKNICPKNIMVSAPEEAVFIAMNTILEKGDHVIAPFPSYQSLYEIAMSIGCEVDKWMPEFDNGWNFNIDTLKSLVRPETKLIIINFPHNPTGCIINMNELKELVEFAKEKNIAIFSDEMYRFLGVDSDSNESICDIGDNVISLFGMSKSYGLAGLRIGWLATQNQAWIDQFLQFKDYTSICSSAPSEILAIIGLRAGKVLIQQNCDLIRDNLNLADRFFEKHSNLFTWWRPQAGCIAFPELISGEKVYDFCQKLVSDVGVMLLPSSVYDYSGNNFRMGFGRKNFKEGIDVLDNYLKNKY